MSNSLDYKLLSNEERKELIREHLLEIANILDAAIELGEEVGFFSLIRYQKEDGSFEYLHGDPEAIKVLIKNALLSVVDKDKSKNSRIGRIITDVFFNILSKGANVTAISVDNISDLQGKIPDEIISKILDELGNDEQ